VSTGGLLPNAVLMLPACKAMMLASAAAEVTSVPASLFLPTDLNHTVQAFMCS